MSCGRPWRRRWAGIWTPSTSSATSPATSRRERAEKVRKRDYFTRYGDQARLVLEALLDKYADEGIEDLAVLKVPPMNQLGTPVEIVRLFGQRGVRGRDQRA